MEYGCSFTSLTLACFFGQPYDIIRLVPIARIGVFFHFDHTMLPTPSTSHVDLDRIYEPAEDSFLLLDTLSSASESAFLAERFSQEPKVPLIVEIGSGSGVVLAFITAHSQAILGRTDALTLGVDINSFACTATRQTVIHACQETSKTIGDTRGPHATFMGCLNADLSSCLLYGAVDFIVFNPPYVPTAELPRESNDVESTLTASPDTFEESSRLLSLSYSGGKDGMEVTNKLLDQLPLILNKERGVAYILLCQQNKPESVVQRIQGWGNAWSVVVVGRSGRTGGWEKLQILRISRTDTEETNVILARRHKIELEYSLDAPPVDIKNSPAG